MKIETLLEMMENDLKLARDTNDVGLKDTYIRSALTLLSRYQLQDVFH